MSGLIVIREEISNDTEEISALLCSSPKGLMIFVVRIFLSPITPWSTNAIEVMKLFNCCKTIASCMNENCEES